MIRSFADIPGGRLACIDTGGDGVVVILLHAATGSAEGWAQQTPAFAQAGYRVVAYDRRGYGCTTTVPGGVKGGTGADDLHALIEHLRVDRVHVIATAEGGAVAVDYALSFPERVRSLVLANSLGGVRDDDYRALARSLRPRDFEELPPELKELGPSYRAANPDGTARWIELERTSRVDGGPPVSPEMKHHVTLARLDTIAIPTLVISSDADLYSPPPVARMLAAHIAGSELVVMPEAGHAAFWEQPEIFNRTVLAFVSRR